MSLPSPGGVLFFSSSTALSYLCYMSPWLLPWVWAEVAMESAKSLVKSLGVKSYFLARFYRNLSISISITSCFNSSLIAGCFLGGRPRGLFTVTTTSSLSFLFAENSRLKGAMVQPGMACTLLKRGCINRMLCLVKNISLALRLFLLMFIVYYNYQWPKMIN